MIHQEFQDAPTLTVAENILLGRLPAHGGFVRWRAVRERAKTVLDQMGVEIDPTRPRGLAARRRAADRRDREGALRPGARADPRRADRRPLPAGGRPACSTSCVVCATRVRRSSTSPTGSTRCRRSPIACRCCATDVVAAEGETNDFDRRALVEAMIGRSTAGVVRPPARTWELGAVPALELREASFNSVLRRLQLTRLPRRDRRALRKARRRIGRRRGGGLRPTHALFGTIAIGDHKLAAKGPAASIASGVGFVPADRKRDAILPCGRLPRTSPHHPGAVSRGSSFLIARSAEARAYRRWHDALSIRSRNDPLQPVGNALWRQPAEGRARALARARLAPARDGRANSRS